MPLDGSQTEAILALQRAIAQRPDAPEFHYELGNLYFDHYQFREATASYRRVLALHGDHAETLNSLANCHYQLGQLAEAASFADRAIKAKSDFPLAWMNRGLALEALCDLDGAIDSYRRAAQLDPKDAKSRTNLGVVLQKIARHHEALAAYDQALAIEPNSVTASCRLMLIQQMPGWTPDAVRREQLRWDQSFAAPLRSAIRPHDNDRTVDGPLRIGYVSADFRNHVVARNLVPLFENHDRKNFSIVCYSNVPRPDGMTNFFRTHCDAWREIYGRSDADAEAMIREDQIDILIDLALHSRGNRLMLFARQPAPVQISFAGYPGTTGLATIQCHLTDPHLEPAYKDAALHSFWCFKPTLQIDVGPLPALTNGHITFGSLNAFFKINREVLTRWAKVLNAIPHSKLTILAPKGSARHRFLGEIGIHSNRVRFVDEQPIENYFRAYNDIDIVLDTYPYNGHSTSLDALWMGVPLVTLAGQTVVGRAGLSQLTNLGLPELICDTEDQFVRTAVALANDLPRLTELRRTLRQRMRSSPLMDANQFTRDIESAYRHIWQEWLSK